MDKYEVDFSYLEPMYGKIDNISAENADDAEQEALDRIKQAYPEAEDIYIEMVKKIS